MKVDIKIPLMVLMLSIIIVLLISILPKDIGNEQKMLIKSSNLEISELLLIKKIGSFGSEAGEFDGPTGLEFFNNKLFVLDSGNNRIQIFSEGLDQVGFSIPVSFPGTQDFEFEMKKTDVRKDFDENFH